MHTVFDTAGNEIKLDKILSKCEGKKPRTDVPSTASVAGRGLRHTVKPALKKNQKVVMSSSGRF